MKKKIQDVYRDHGFGFPVTLLHVPMTEIRGEWVPSINQRNLQERVLEALVLKTSRLTGSEVHFIRLFSERTLAQFAARFDVTHPAVLKWERSAGKATGMGWTTEKDVRLFALSCLAPKAQRFLVAYERLADVASKKTLPLKIDLEKKSA
jgi:DNA-binding transcriptional regulator YiaG